MQLKKNCLKCNAEIIVPILEEEHKYEIWGSVVQHMPMWAIKFVRDYSVLNAIEAKVLVKHINKTYGMCFNCNYEALKEENTTCPKCNAFNLNWDLITSFSEGFWMALEIKLNSVFQDFEHEDIARFWCDGIVPFLYDYKLMSKANIKYRKHILIEIKTGVSGQERFKTKLNFGKQTVLKLLNNESIIKCIPNGKGTEWLEIDLKAKLIEIYLK